MNHVSLMEVYISHACFLCSYVVDITVIEKRHSNLNSTSMEVAGFLRSMLALHSLDIPISELVTDQHLRILPLMRKRYWADSNPIT